MTKTRITVTVDPDIEEWLRAGTKRHGRSLSELVRICLDEFKQEHPNRFLTADKARSKSEDAWRVRSASEGGAKIIVKSTLLAALTIFCLALATPEARAVPWSPFVEIAKQMPTQTCQNVRH